MNPIDSGADSVLWYSVGVWRRFKQLTHEQRKEAALAADGVFERVPVWQVATETEIPHFGLCSGWKCVAIASCFIVSRSITDHVASPFLAAARQAKILAECVEEEGESDELMAIKEHARIYAESGDFMPE